jgi:hypothetical protein
MAKKLNTKVAVIGIVLIVFVIGGGAALLVYRHIQHDPERALLKGREALPQAIIKRPSPTSDGLIPSARRMKTRLNGCLNCRNSIYYKTPSLKRTGARPGAAGKKLSLTTRRMSWHAANYWTFTSRRRTPVIPGYGKMCMITPKKSWMF